MTDQEAQDMLVKLTEHYKEPVMPMSQYCKKLELWANLIEEHHRDKDAELHHLLDSIEKIRRSIHKSSFLARQLYAGEKLRTEKCPVHNGHWSGLEWEMRDGSTNACPHKCNLTGWIKNA